MSMSRMMLFVSNNNARGKALWWVLGILCTIIIVITVSLALVVMRLRIQAEELAAINTRNFLAEYSNRLEQGQISEEYVDTFEALVDLCMQPEVERSARVLIFSRILLVTEDGHVSSDEIHIIVSLHDVLRENPTIDSMKIYEIIHEHDTKTK